MYWRRRPFESVFATLYLPLATWASWYTAAVAREWRHLQSSGTGGTAAAAPPSPLALSLPKGRGYRMRGGRGGGGRGTRGRYGTAGVHVGRAPQAAAASAARQPVVAGRTTVVGAIKVVE